MKILKLKVVLETDNAATCMDPEDCEAQDLLSDRYFITVGDIEMEYHPSFGHSPYLKNRLRDRDKYPRNLGRILNKVLKSGKSQGFNLEEGDEFRFTLEQLTHYDDPKSPIDEKSKRLIEIYKSFLQNELPKLTYVYQRRRPNSRFFDLVVKH
tara:strand:- start:1105 stop:1563 length:459 start_codon:yes stop_codon:yes gene_type:complete